MEIFRHYYSPEEIGSSNFFTQHMNNFGFCNLDGARINYTWNGTSSPTASFRYNLDSKKQTYLFLNPRRTIGVYYYYTLHNMGVHLSNGTVYYSNDTTNSPSNNSISPATVIFLPLKNNGFLLNIRALGYSSPNPSTISNDARDRGFLINTPTPSLNTKIYMTNRVDDYRHTGVLTFIGIPPCKGNINWTYLLFTSATFNGNYTSNYNYAYIDYGDGKVIEMPFMSNFIREVGNYPAYNELTYTNVNENICSMIKIPYDNNYIDGLYLLTTSPQQLEDATFFSFDGRNFLNVFNNYVLELPPSTN